MIDWLVYLFIYLFVCLFIYLFIDATNTPPKINMLIADCYFVVIGLVQDTPQFFALHLKIDTVGLLSLLASSSGQRIFIYIRGQYGIHKNIYLQGGPN